MIQKLEDKLKREVQFRIENQRKLHTHLHEAGTQLETRLISKFEQEIQQLTQKVSSIESNLGNWEPKLIQDLTDNRLKINQFDQECNQVINNMKTELALQYEQTDLYQEKVVDREQDFKEKVLQKSLKQLESERDGMERELTRRILEFNWKVKEESDKLEDMVKAEIAGIREEIDREREERQIKDQDLLNGMQRLFVI
eukprot:403335661